MCKDGESLKFDGRKSPEFEGREHQRATALSAIDEMPRANASSVAFPGELLADGMRVYIANRRVPIELPAYGTLTFPYLWREGPAGVYPAPIRDAKTRTASASGRTNAP